MATYETRGSITIDAPPEHIMAVLSDVEKYPEWVAVVQSVTISVKDESGRPRLIQVYVKKGVFRDELEFEVAWDGNSRVDWILLGSFIERSNIGSYSLTARGENSTDVLFDVSLKAELPVSEQRRHKISENILDSALTGLSVRVAQTQA